jgi:flavorubredoxin
MVGVLGLIAGIVAWVLWYWQRASREVVSSVEVLNPGGDRGTALLVYHPGRRGFFRSVIQAFAGGLVSGGWRVEITTASCQAPNDLSGYDLLVLGGPTYFWTPARPITRYVRRLGDLEGKPTVTIVTGFGSTGRSKSILEKLVQEANGKLVTSLALFKLRPNDEEDPRPNREVAMEMATRAGAAISVSHD